MKAIPSKTASSSKPVVYHTFNL